MIFLPTRGRPWALKRFMQAYKDTKAVLPVTIIVDIGDCCMEAYEDLWRSQECPPGWHFFKNADAGDLGAACNNAFAAFPDEDFYAIVADDVVPRTAYWDILLRRKCLPHFLAWPYDGIHAQGEFAATHPFFGGGLVRAFGWLMPPYVKRGSADLIWRDFALELGLAAFCPDILLEHMHYHVGKADFDITYAGQPSHSADKKRYDAYKASASWLRDVARVREALKLNQPPLEGTSSCTP